MGRIWSPQQEAVFEWFSVGDGNLVVEALAGSGKTSTILEGVMRAPEQRILLAAFNTGIKDELAARNQNPCAEVKTLHGVGFAAILKRWERIQVCNTGARVERLLDEVCDGTVPDPIRRLVGKLCTKGREMAPHAVDPIELMDIAEKFECVPDEEWTEDGYDVHLVAGLAIKAMELAAIKRPVDGIDFADMLYLPVRNKWLRKRAYDLLVVDEAQDMSATQIEIATGSCAGRICVVGDSHQAIYGFRGADSQSLSRLTAELKARVLGLTVTYRCARVIAERAAQLVPDLQAAPNAPEGQILGPMPIEGLTAAAGPGDFVLSRINAPLAKVAMSLLRANKRAKVLGKDIGAGLKALARTLAKGKGADMPGFLAKLAAWESREILRVIASGRPLQVELIQDKAETLRVVADGATGVRELEARLEHLFSDEAGVGAVICSSIHKAKGKEAQRVFVLKDTLYPKRPKDAKPMPWEALEEANLEYVAVTRAIETLVWVVGK